MDSSLAVGSQVPDGNSEHKLEISIVMPCLNEAETIGTCVRKAQAALRECDLLGEVIVADNGSTDNSCELAASLGARVVHVQAKGYGSALRGGIQAARGRFILMGDADDSYDFGHVNRFVDALRGGYDLVMGNRFAGGIAAGAMPPLHRYLGNPVLSAIGRLLFRSPIGDFHCGLRAFSKDAFERMQLRSPGMEFASEMVVRATLLNMRITEVSTTLKKDGRSRPPHLRTWRDGWRHFRFLLLYSPRWLFFVPGAALITGGTVVYSVLLFGPVTIGTVRFDVNTMMYGASAILIGYQAIIFAMFAKILGVTQGILPPNKRLESLFKWINLEVGVAIGVLLLIIGMAVSVATVVFWEHTGFGTLNPTHMIRLVSAGLLCLTLGVETIFSSFFLSVLGYVRGA